MTHSAVLFDLDGTLLDTLEDLADSMNVVLKAHGFPVHGLDAYRYFVGDGVENLVLRSLPLPERDSEVFLRECVSKMRAEYTARWKDKTRLYDGIPELLDSLSARGVKTAVLSNKPHSATVQVVDHFLGKWRFDATLGARAGVPIKPDAGAALDVCRALDSPPESFLYLGDTNTDMITARSAGMFAVGVLWGFRTEEELRTSGANAVIRHPLEALDLL
jgi:phosphoglycolate phosphatase